MPTFSLDIVSFVLGTAFGIILVFALVAVVRSRD